jgi:hypothetical protein
VPAKNIRCSGGVTSYREHQAFEARWCDVMLVGLWDAASGVRLAEGSEFAAVEGSGQGSSLEQLLRTVDDKLQAEGTEETVRWLGTFSSRHLEGAQHHTFGKDVWTYYVRSEPLEEERNRWGYNAADTVPIELHWAAEANLARVLHDVPGVQCPYFYLSANHMFFVHAEDAGFSAVNKSVGLSVGGCGGSFKPASRYKQAKPSLPDVHIEGDPAHPAAEFQKRLRVAREAVLRCGWGELNAETQDLHLKYKCMELFSQIGYKQWYVSDANNEQLLALAEHVREHANVSEQKAPGLSIFQHYQVASAAVTESGVPKHIDKISLHVPSLPTELQECWQPVCQKMGDIVHTDVRIHVGHGVCGVNVAWNIVPLTLFQRISRQLHSCHPLVFSQVMSDYARKVRRCKANIAAVHDAVAQRLCRVLRHIWRNNDASDHMTVLLGVPLETPGLYELHMYLKVMAMGQGATHVNRLPKGRALEVWDIGNLSQCTKCGVYMIVDVGYMPEGVFKRNGEAAWWCKECSEQNVARNCVMVQATDIQIRACEEASETRRT